MRTLWPSYLLICGAAAAQPCEKLLTVGAVDVFKSPTSLTWSAGLAIDADGAPNAYGPDGKGLDHLANAGRPGNWWGLATKDGEPVIQTAADPYPGYYVSTTALEDKRYASTDPRRYVDSGKTPYVVVPPQLLKQGARLGDFAAVVNEKNGRVVYAQVADIGPKDKLGEGSIALADALDVKSDPKRGGTAGGIRYVVFPSSGDGRPRSAEETRREGSRLYGAATRCVSPP
ncbi:MAG: hypothetical protein JNK82_00075 [Myxococcaceae bacterium]|nr:hypothetical protein [Myxococcaceae bacterium]